MNAPISQHFRLRLPLDIKAWIVAQARANRRSMNAEIVFRLEQDRSAESNPTAAEVSEA